MSRKAGTLFRLFLRAYPPQFRRRFGAEMEDAFLEGCREHRARGRVALLAFVLRTGADLGLAGVKERWRAAGWRDEVPVADDNLNGRRRRMGMTGMIEALWQDLRFGVRSLRRRPGFTAVAVTTLALGIGANSAIFSVVNGVLLRPLPYPEPDRVVMVWEHDSDDPEGRSVLSGPDIADLDSLPALEALRGYQGTTVTLSTGDRPEVVDAVQVTGGFLEVFGLAPAVGRDIRPQEGDHADAPNIVVLSHELWQRLYGGSPEVVGSTIELSEQSFEIVGVAPRGFDYPDGTDVWLPYVRPESCGRACHIYRAVGRLAPGTTMDSAAPQLDRLAALLQDAYPDSNYDVSFRMEALEDYLLGDVRQGLWLLLGAVGVVLLIACANVANLLLVRASVRRGEVAVRGALGASRGRLTAQVLVESLLLALAGGGLGLVLAWGGVRLLRTVDPGTIPRIEGVAVDGTVVLFTLGVGLMVALVFGLSPALKLSRTSLLENLVPGGRSRAGGPREGRSRAMLLVAEVALSLFLLVGAGLVLKSFARLHAVDLGFGAREVVRFSVSLPSARYDTLPEVAGFVRRLENRLRAIPGVESVGSVYGPPFGSGNIVGEVLVEGRPPPEPTDETYAAVHPATPGYFRTLEIPVLTGRGIEAPDRIETVPVAVVSQRFVEENFPDENPLGKRFRVTSSFGYRNPNPTWTVVGVVPDVKRSLKGQEWPSVYVPHSQFGPGYMTVHLRGAAGSAGLLAAAREEVRRLDPNLALRNVESLEQAVSRNAAPTRFYLTLIGLFAALAVVLAGVGLYGVVSYLVSRRTREIGVRLALGAGEVKIVRMVLVQGLRPAALGVALGLGAAWAGARVAESILFQVSPRDPLVFGGVTSLLVAVVVLATLLPARRASRVDPSLALRQE